MYPHSYYQDRVGVQIPIKNDEDSQALPSYDDWESNRNQQRNQPQAPNQNFQKGINAANFQPSYQSQFNQQPNNQNMIQDRNYNQRAVNDPFQKQNEQINQQYRPNNNRQFDQYSNNQNQIMNPNQYNQQRNQINSQPIYNGSENQDSPYKQNSQKKSTLAIQEKTNNLSSIRQNSQQGSQFNGELDLGSGQEFNYGIPLGSGQMNQMPMQKQILQPYNKTTEYTQLQNTQKSKIENKYGQTNQYDQKPQLNTTAIDNYNETQPIQDVNITHTGMMNNTYADQPLITPSKGKSDFIDLMNKTDMNITTTNLNQTASYYNNSNNINNNAGNNNLGIQQPQDQQQNQSYIRSSNQIGQVEEALKERISHQQNRDTNFDASTHQKTGSIIHARSNYSGMYTYQHDNINNRNQAINNASAHLAIESDQKKQFMNNDGKIVNVDDPCFHDNYDIQQQLNLTQFNIKNLSPLEISYLKKAQKILNTNFFYEKLPINYKSFTIPDNMKPFYKFFFLEYIIPMITVFLIHILLWGVQIGVKDYCFQESTFCKCDNFSIKIWTFFKQLISWKLGLICCKNITLIEIGGERHPYMESFLIYIVGIGIDFVMIVGLGMNYDWQFYAMIFCVGYIVTIHTIKFKQFTHISKKGQGLYLYDLNLVVIIVFIYFALPAIYKSLIQRQDYTEGRNTFLYLYPLLEWVFELFSNHVLERAEYAQFFQYQLYLLILGMKVGIMTSVSSSNFEFWYLGVLFCIKRVFESTNILYINIRKLIYRLFPPNLKYLISMDELPNYRKGREGFLLENVVWIGMYYWWYKTETIVPGFVKQYIIVNNCEFSAETLFKNVTWERPFFCWLFLFGATIISIFVNSNQRLDMIKWIGSPKHNFLENVFTRMFGWYLFQIALGVSYSISREDILTYTNF